MKTSELQGSALDWAVAKCEGTSANFLVANNYGGEHFYQYSTNWLSGGPIIEREKIETYRDENYDFDEPWVCYIGSRSNPEGNGPTPLVAAMRCYVASKLGDEVEIPNELMEK